MVAGVLHYCRISSGRRSILNSNFKVPSGFVGLTSTYISSTLNQFQTVTDCCVVFIVGEIIVVGVCNSLSGWQDAPAGLHWPTSR